MTNQFDLTPYILVLIRRRKAIAIHFIGIAVVAILYAFLLTKQEFKSELVFLPSGSENALGSVVAGISIPSSASSSSDIMPEQIETIFSSKALKRNVIEKFDLYDHYKMTKNQNKFENTLKLLDKCLMIETDSRGNLGFAKTVSFTLTAFHNSRDTAFLMVNFAYDLLDSAVKSVSSDRAHRNRMFVEGQLSKSKEVLDSLQKAMQQFQVQNKAYDIPEQVKLSIKAYSDLKAMLLENELRMQAIHNEFSGETPELVSLQKETKAAQEKLDQIEKHQSPDVMPGLESSTKLMPAYANLMRDLEIQDQLILFISRELEQAKLKESKNVSGLVVVDPAFVPEYKARPKRVKIVVMIVGLYMLFVFCFVAIQELYRSTLKDSEPVKAIWDIMRSKHKN